MTGLVVTADAAWFGAGDLDGPVAVAVEDDRVVWSGSPARAPEGPRLAVEGVLLPGLVDHHVHIGLVASDALLDAGLTTVRDLGWIPSDIWPKAEASESGSVAGPRILAAGPFVTVPGGYPTRQVWAPHGIAREVNGPADAADAVRALARERPCTVKVALNSEAGPCLDDETLAAVVATARECALPVTAHTEGPGQAERAVAAGVDELAHTPFDERLDDRLLDRLAATTRIVSTLDIHGWGADTPERRTAVDNLRRFHRRGGAIRYGTDLGNGPLPEGVNAREIAALEQAGLRPSELLTAMTGGVADGGLRPGARADLVAVPADPLTAPARLAEATAVLKAGTPTGRGTVTGAAATGAAPTRRETT